MEFKRLEWSRKGIHLKIFFFCRWKLEEKDVYSYVPQSFSYSVNFLDADFDAGKDSNEFWHR